MKNANSELFDLIKTLNASESRYFVLYAKRHFTKDTNYLQLFQYIQKMDSYVESEVLKHFDTSTWINHFAVIKKQLYYTLLEALHQYDEYGNLEQEIKKGIHYSHLLIKKGLFEQCKKIVEKYKKQAYEIEKHEYVLELIEIEKKLINKAYIHKESDELIKRIAAEESTCLAQIQLSAKYWKQSSIIYKQHYQKKISIGQASSELKELIKQPEFTDYSLAKTCKAKLDFLQINALHSFISRDTEQAYAFNHTFLAYLDTQAKMRTLHADRYFSVLNNYLIDSLILRKFDVLQAGIIQLRSIAKLPEFKHISNIEANVFRLSYTLELNYYVSQQLFEKGLAVIPQIQLGLSKYQNKIIKPSIVTMQYLCAYILFFCGQYKACLDQLDKIINDKEAVHIKDIYRDARFIQILCHFELGHFQLLESISIAFQRFLLKEKTSYKTYSSILKHIHTAIKNPFKDQYSKLAQDLTRLASASGEQQVFNNFNYSLWLEKSTFKTKFKK